ncbi:MAG: DUF2306 domain-containing protein [Cytophagaceae bacterium]
MSTVLIKKYTGPIIFWTPVIFLSLLLSYNSILYFFNGSDYGILPEKLNELKDPLWKASFYLHIPSGIVCLLSPLIAFLAPLLKKGWQLHRTAGKFYAWATLALVCPTGVYMSFFAKGGIISKTGFLIQGLFLFYFTYKAVLDVKNGDMKGHREHMIRSYSMASAVLSFRILHLLLLICNIPYTEVYTLSQWMSMTIHLLAAEVIIEYNKKKSILITT